MAATEPVREFVYIQSKVRDLVRRNELRLSEGFLTALNEQLVGIVERAATRCRANGRKTLDAIDL